MKIFLIILFSMILLPSIALCNHKDSLATDSSKVESNFDNKPTKDSSEIVIIQESNIEQNEVEVMIAPPSNGLFTIYTTFIYYSAGGKVEYFSSYYLNSLPNGSLYDLIY
jgi:hypothetical protein